jgi:large conductance mechanosensitive channel
MWNEFKEFALKGNFLDLAIAFVIGAAFATVITSLVDNIIMPPIGMLLGGVDFASLYINLSGTAYPSLAAAQEAGAPTINYGLFINALITFLIVAFVLFLIVRAYNRMRPAVVVATKDCPFCASSIPLAATRCPNCTSQLAGGGPA